MSDELELINLFNNLDIESEEEFEDNLEYNYDQIIDDYAYVQEKIDHEKCILPEKYNDLINAVFVIINKDPTFTAEIVDNIIILDNILYGLNPQFKDGLLPFKAILRLSEFNKRKIPQRNDPTWWETSKCSKFEDLMSHLRNYSCENNKKYDANEVILIKNDIIDLACKIVQKEFEYKDDVTINTSLLNMFNIANYLERYFYKKIGSFYSEEIKFTNEYFIEFSDYVLKKLVSFDSRNYKFHNEYYVKNIKVALLKVLRGAQNMSILFGPYGYDAFSNNYDIMDLTLQEIFEFKREALSYFALNNLIELKLHNKKINLIDPDDYVNFIFRGASLI
jgi:hypothetical protein